MATTGTTKEKAIVRCLECGAMIAAEPDGDGSFTPLGTESACSCGGSVFQHLR